ncbi:MAG: DoxX family protein [Acidimicrobiia bacterium]|nr:DoxX family protein [Acidimicrobiia bacterium]
MNIIGKIAQTAAALWILDVWFLRFSKDTGYRGGDATNMKEEFAVYGLSETQMYAVGATKVGLATAMLVGHAVPKVTRPASIGLATLMVGAIGMHIKAGDPVKQYLPALSVFSLATASAVLNGKTDSSPTEVSVAPSFE